MRTTMLMTLALLAAGGCQLQDENPNWSPAGDLPSWAYDAPFYYRPSEDLAVAETVGNGVPVYFTRHRLFHVRHPNGTQVPTVPRVAVWYSLDQGVKWTRAGYFGAEQTHFGFHAEVDGPHWIRFIGSGQPRVESSPASPDRVYIVDTVPAYIQLKLTPPTIERDEDGKIKGPHIYEVGEDVTVSWNVSDRTLEVDSIKMATTFGRYPEDVVWKDFPLNLKTDGQMTVPVPAEASQPGGGMMRYRIEAHDRAGNISYVFSNIMVVDGEGEPAPRPAPAAPTPLVAQEHGRPGERPGWPAAGMLVRGGSGRVLDWIPKLDRKYDSVILQFSANNGRSWRTVAENLRAGKTVHWALPQVNSKICLVRIVGLAGEEKIMLATSAAFTVHTAPTAIRLGPEPLKPEAD